MMRRVCVCIAGAALVAGFAAGCREKGSSTTQPEATAQAESEGIPSAFRVDSIEGMTVSLQPAKGRALLLLLWNTRDPKMDDQAKAAVALYRRFHGKGLDVLSLCTDASEDSILGFAQRWQLPWAQVKDASLGDKRPAALSGVSRTPAAVLTLPAGDPVALKLEDEQAAHASVAKALGVALADVPMPAKAAPRITQPTQGVEIPYELIAAIGQDGGKDPGKIADVVLGLLKDRQAGPDGIVQAICELAPEEAPKILEASLSKLSGEEQFLFIKGVMVKAHEGLEVVFPYVKKLDDKGADSARLSNWDRNQIGRALVLAGEAERGEAILKAVAEKSGKNHPWWYAAGWASLVAGKGKDARSAFERVYRKDGRYDGVAANIAGNVAGWFLGKVDRKALTSAIGEKMALFFVAERHLLGGDAERARPIYRACEKLSEGADPWPSSWARIRLMQIHGKLPGLPRPLSPENRIWQQKPASSPASRPATTRSM